MQMSIKMYKCTCCFFSVIKDVEAQQVKSFIYISMKCIFCNQIMQGKYNFNFTTLEKPPKVSSYC